jgi:trehalose/maltose hydrolase-like predicted phosphorylase
MTDAIAAIDSSALGTPGCSAYDYMRRSIDPFLAAPFDQFHETRTGGAFNFTTGQGGYLQEFLYGFTGLRWGTDAVTIDPFLPAQLPGVEVTGVKWHGRTFDISVGRQTTKLTLRSGPPLPVRAGSGNVRRLGPGATFHTPTRHPAQTPDPPKCDTTGTSGTNP